MCISDIESISQLELVSERERKIVRERGGRETMMIIIMMMMMMMMMITTSRSTPQCRNETGSGFNLTAMALTRRDIPDTHCQDGSMAKMYVRSCCNGPDRGDFCNVTQKTPRWIIVFGNGNEDAWCWDEKSCESREKNLTSSKYLPEYFQRNGTHRFDEKVGIFSKSGEGNPNFYASYSVFVPSCSSDLFLGASLGSEPPYFRGSIIARQVLSTLQDEMIASASQSPNQELDVIIVGGAGILASISRLSTYLPSNASLYVVCDGCMMFDDTKGESTKCDENESPLNCKPSSTLRAATSLWNVETFSWCKSRHIWECLLFENAQHSSTFPLLVQQALYDSSIVTQNNDKTPEQIREMINTSLSSERVNVRIGSACSSPSSIFTTESVFSVRYGQGLPPPNAAAALYSLIDGRGGTNFVDTCHGESCNPTCSS